MARSIKLKLRNDMFRKWRDYTYDVVGKSKEEREKMEREKVFINNNKQIEKENDEKIKEEMIKAEEEKQRYEEQKKMLREKMRQYKEEREKLIGNKKSMTDINEKSLEILAKQNKIRLENKAEIKKQILDKLNFELEMYL